MLLILAWDLVVGETFYTDLVSENLVGNYTDNDGRVKFWFSTCKLEAASVKCVRE